MPEPADRTTTSLPDRGEPRLARCALCLHRHACFVAERPVTRVDGDRAWWPFPVCLGCLMRAADPAARSTCAESVSPA